LVHCLMQEVSLSLETIGEKYGEVAYNDDLEGGREGGRGR